MIQMSSKLPNLYYFDQPSGINIDQIEGDAIVFIGAAGPTVEEPTRYGGNQRRYIHANTYFVKNKQFVMNDLNEIKRVTFKLEEHLWNSMKEKLREGGKIVLQNSRSDEAVSEQISLLASREGFPYTHVAVYFSENGESIKFLRAGGSTLPFPALSSTTPSTTFTMNDNIHPILKEYLMRQQDPTYNLLTLLYKIEASPDFMKSNKLYQMKRSPIGFGMTLGSTQEVTVDGMIAMFHKAKGTTFMSCQAFEESVKQITKTTPQQSVLSDFQQFYNSNKHNPSLMPRCVLVEKWARSYQNNHGQNPFAILRGPKPAGFLCNLFNSTPECIALFNKFLAGEVVPESLNRIMQEPQIKDNSHHHSFRPLLN